jgi:mannose-6-phosphate isomerase-like protein (cupin superfamily)
VPFFCFPKLKFLLFKQQADRRRIEGVKLVREVGRIKVDFKPINLQEKLGKFTDHWSPKIIAQINDYHLSIVKLQGDFVWHMHDDTDEMFLAIDGEMEIVFRDGKVVLKPGELFVVPKGVEHKPFAKNECNVLLFEPAGTINTGDVCGEMTAEEDIWI